MQIRTPQERLAARQRSERAVRTAQAELLCSVSILRSGLTLLTPLCGGAAWWVTLLSLLPGVAVFLLAALALRLSGTATLTELARRLLGRTGVWLLSGLLAALLLMDAAASLTALITLFTQGIGTRGTQLTLTLLTVGALALGLHREGLPRGICLLRWPLLAGAVLVVLAQLKGLRADHLFPLTGEGLSTAALAMRGGVGIAWPLLMLLTIPPVRERPRPVSLAVATLGAVVPLLLISLGMPPEAFPPGLSLAGSLLLPARLAPTAVQTLTYCLEMVGLFLAVGSAALLATVQLEIPLGRRYGALPWLALGLLAATQAADVSALWRMLTALSPWLLLPLAAMIIPCAGLALRLPPERRNRP